MLPESADSLTPTIDLRKIHRVDLERLPAKEQIKIIALGCIACLNKGDLGGETSPVLDYLAPGCLVEPTLDGQDQDTKDLVSPFERMAMYRKILEEHPEFQMHVDGLDIQVDEELGKAVVYVYGSTTGLHPGVSIGRVGVLEYGRFEGRWLSTKYMGARGQSMV